MIRVIIFCSCALLVARCAWGQASGTPAALPGDSAGTGRTCSVTVAAGTDSAIVEIDSKYRGIAPCSWDSLLPGPHVVRALHRDVGNWFLQPASDTIVLGPGERTVLRFRLNRWFTITSTPTGAEVYLGDSLAGTTPLLMTSDPRAIRGPIRIQLPGYDTASVTLSGDRESVYRYSLRREWLAHPAENERPFLNPSGAQPPPSSLIYLSGGGTILLGSVAAYFKIKADDRHSAYLLTGDPALAAQTHRLDNDAALFLAVTEIGFAFLTYFLLSQ